MQSWPLEGTAAGGWKRKGLLTVVCRGRGGGTLTYLLQMCGGEQVVIGLQREELGEGVDRTDVLQMVTRDILHRRKQSTD